MSDILPSQSHLIWLLLDLSWQQIQDNLCFNFPQISSIYDYTPVVFLFRGSKMDHRIIPWEWKLQFSFTMGCYFCCSCYCCTQIMLLFRFLTSSWKTNQNHNMVNIELTTIQNYYGQRYNDNKQTVYIKSGEKKILFTRSSLH